MKVMVVDDSIFMRQKFKSFLQKQGFEVCEAENGESAIKKYQMEKPDIVTMDITMPKMDGITSLEKIIEFDKEAKIIMISALGKQELVKKSLLLGAKNYIIKPLDRKKVLERIMLVLKRYSE